VLEDEDDGKEGGNGVEEAEGLSFLEEGAKEVEFSIHLWEGCFRHCPLPMTPRI